VREDEPRRMPLPDARRAFVLAFFLLMLGGCQGAVYALPEVTPEEIAEANAEIDAAPMRTVVSRSTNEAIELLNSVGSRLKAVAGPVCAQAKSETCSFNFNYKTSPEENAWASGERDITVTTTLMRYLMNEDEVAAAVAHEMGHHIAGHIGKSKSTTVGGGLFGGILLGAVAVLGGGDQATVQEWTENGQMIGAKIGRLSFSKEHEREADYLGAYLMARAGFNLERGGAIWLRLAKQPEATRETDLFDPHPASADRMAAWKLTIQEIRSSPDLIPHWGS